MTITIMCESRTATVSFITWNNWTKHTHNNKAGRLYQHFTCQLNMCSMFPPFCRTSQSNERLSRHSRNYIAIVHRQERRLNGVVVWMKWLWFVPDFMQILSIFLKLQVVKQSGPAFLACPVVMYLQLNCCPRIMQTLRKMHVVCA